MDPDGTKNKNILKNTHILPVSRKRTHLIIYTRVVSRRGDAEPSTLTLNPKPQTLDTIICTCAKYKCPLFTLYLATGMVVGLFIEDLSPSHVSHDHPVSENHIVWRQNKVLHQRRSCLFLRQIPSNRTQQEGGHCSILLSYELWNWHRSPFRKKRKEPSLVELWPALLLQCR